MFVRRAPFPSLPRLWLVVAIALLAGLSFGVFTPPRIRPGHQYVGM